MQPQYQFHLQQTVRDGLYGKVGTYVVTADDSGYDLIMPETVRIGPFESARIDLKVRVVCTQVGTAGTDASLPYLLIPRSSISKTPLRLANSVGLIDRGYRGSLQVALDNTSDKPAIISRGDRLFQLVAPGLVPIARVRVVPFDEQLSETKRGSGGFGSTGAGGLQASTAVLPEKGSFLVTVLTQTTVVMTAAAVTALAATAAMSMWCTPR